MRRVPLALALASLALVALATAALASRPHGRSDRAADLETAKAATARFHSVAEALKAGYVAPPDAPASCVTSPQGGMGIHYEHPVLMKSPGVDIRKPEILVYEKAPSGDLRLVALEYFKNDADQNLRTRPDRPRLFHRWFDGPMPSHHPGMGIHYDLHVWIWKANPRGMFDAWNPTVKCAP